MPPSVPIYCEQAPDIEYRGGMFHITDKVGDVVIIRCFQPNAFLTLFRRAGEAARQHRFGSAEIIDFPIERLGAS